MPLAAPSGKPEKGGSKKSHYFLPVLILSLCTLLMGVQLLGYYGVQKLDTAVRKHTKPVVASAAPVSPQPELEQAVPAQVAVSQVPVEQPEPAAAPAAQPAPRQEPPGSVIRGVPEAGKRLALTFDDGPSSQYTPAYLKVLRDNGVRATFFMVGRQLKSFPELAAMIAADGHAIGNHTFDHPNLRRVSNDTIKQQIRSTNELLEQATGQQIRYFRPPGGNTNQTVTDIAAGEGLRVIMWNIDPRDWERSKTPDQIINHILNNLQPGGIVVMHERKPQTLAALPVLISKLKEQGWELVTVTELLAGGGTAEQVESPYPLASDQDLSETVLIDPGPEQVLP